MEKGFSINNASFIRIRKMKEKEAWTCIEHAEFIKYF